MDTQEQFPLRGCPRRETGSLTVTLECLTAPVKNLLAAPSVCSQPSQAGAGCTSLAPAPGLPEPQDSPNSPSSPQPTTQWCFLRGFLCVSEEETLGGCSFPHPEFQTKPLLVSGRVPVCTRSYTHQHTLVPSRAGCWWGPGTCSLPGLTSQGGRWAHKHGNARGIMGWVLE